MKLEEQIEKLSECGLALSPGIAVDDLVSFNSREEYESEPYEHILFAMSNEADSGPSGHRMCPNAYGFDMEGVCESGEYLRLVQQLCRTAGTPDLIDFETNLDEDPENAWIRYQVNGEKSEFHFEQIGDFANASAIAHIAGDIERDGKRFYQIDHQGQDMRLYYLTSEDAKALQGLSPLKIIPLNPTAEEKEADERRRAEEERKAKEARKAKREAERELAEAGRAEPPPIPPSVRQEPPPIPTPQSSPKPWWKFW